MNTSLFLAQLFGLYFIVAGILVAWRQQSLIKASKDFGRNRGMILAIAFVELVAGLAIVLGHPVWTFDWNGIITFIGAVMIAESIIYLALPFRVIKKCIAYFNRPPWYSAGGLLAFIAGIYLAGIGFGFF